ncbi:MAG: hypothetical protein AUH96_05850 [Nitrospirae bacterium 13_2_20CM_2_61_4]|nr:MAG: hypothetical protein AUH96_05850 [Nitrospirae bacterium 13_2_20CM_2_61_4]
MTALLIVSIPVDLWALGLTARTYFLERHGLELEGAIGLALWWQGAVIGIAFAAAAYFALPTAMSVAKRIAAGIIEGIKKIFPGFSIAEQITLELLLWSIPTIVVLGVLALIALKIYGWRIKATVKSAGRPTAAPLGERVRRWDYARVPRDPGLLLASFAGVILVLTIVFWLFLPVTTPHPSEDYKVQVKKPVKPLKPEDMLKQTEMSLAKADAVLHSLEQEKGKEKKQAKKPEQKGK